MAPLNPPSWLQAGTYPARLDRLAAAATLPPLHGVGPLAVRSGVRPSPGNTALQVTQRATPGMVVTVSAGVAFVQAASATGGVYTVSNDAPYDVTITGAHATLGRRDLIIARVYDSEASGSANQWTLEVVTGTPASSPVAPAVPPAAIPLAMVTVNAAASSITNANITDQRAFVAALGGAIPAPASALPANPHPGMAAYDLTNLLPLWHNGTGWVGWRNEGYQTAAGVASILAAYAPSYAADEGGNRTVSAAAAWLDYTAAPSLNVTVPASGKLLISWGFSGWNSNSADSTLRVAPQISGANTVPPSTGYSACVAGPAVANSLTPSQSASRTKLYTGLTAGPTTVKLMGRLSSGTTATHQITDSWLCVQPVW
ncbi:hypothetical protein ACFY05_32120 [Microtetraspora fusca]|uniref:Minor tail protein n=1 Tax=Microtetraspora fusca TaxID=1997 RepID=A0ABW6VDS9_MICFU